MVDEPVVHATMGPPKPQAEAEKPDKPWTLQELLAGVRRREKVNLTLDGTQRPIYIRPILAHELAEVNKTFSDEDMHTRMAAIASKCVAEPQMTFDQANQLLPGHLQLIVNEVWRISGYHVETRKNLTG